MITLKRIYFFRPNLKNHFYLYYSWIRAAKEKGVDVTMLTVMSAKQKRQQLNEYNEVIKLPNVNVLITPHEKLNILYTILLLCWYAIKFKNVALVAKKVDVRPLNTVKKLFNRKFKYFIEVEGDALTECEYLQENPYKNGFYDSYLHSAKRQINQFAEKIQHADGLLVLSNTFKKVLLQRHAFLSADNIQVISTGFEKHKFSYNEANRQSVRAQLNITDEPVFVYAGNVYYSWQNINKTLKFFAYFLKNVEASAKFIILTHVSDQPIVQDFVAKLDIDPSNIIIKEVPNSEVGHYYNAADVCVLLRENHLMCNVASPGKIGEYAASGTPILTSAYIGDYAPLFKEQKLVAQIDDIDDFQLMSEKVNALLHTPTEQKIAFSEWSNNKLSSKSNVDSFIKAFEM